MGHATEPMAVDARLMEEIQLFPVIIPSSPSGFPNGGPRAVDSGKSYCVCAAGGFAPSTNQTGAEFSLHIVPLCIANPGLFFAASNFGFH